MSSANPIISLVNQYTDEGYAGLALGDAYLRGVRSKINAVGAAAGVSTLTFTAADTHTYTITIYGIPVSFTSGSGATVAQIRDGILAAIAAIPALVGLVAAIASGNLVQLTEKDPTNGSMGLTGNDGDTAITVVTAHSTLQPMPAGIAVKAGTDNDMEIALLSGSGDVVVGVTMFQHAPVRDLTYPNPSQVLYAPNSTIPVIYRGEVQVAVEEAVTPASPVYTRYASGAGGTQPGAFRASGDTSTAKQLTTGFAYTRNSSVNMFAPLAINLV